MFLSLFLSVFLLLTLLRHKIDLYLLFHIWIIIFIVNYFHYSFLVWRLLFGYWISVEYEQKFLNFLLFVKYEDLSAVSSYFYYYIFFSSFSAHSKWRSRASFIFKLRATKQNKNIIYFSLPLHWKITTISWYHFRHFYSFRVAKMFRFRMRPLLTMESQIKF